MEKTRAVTLLLLCVALVTVVCKAEEEVEGQGVMASIEKRALPTCEAAQDCKKRKCKCGEELPDCGQDPNDKMAKTYICQVLPICGITQNCTNRKCKCGEDRPDCGRAPKLKLYICQ